MEASAKEGEPVRSELESANPSDPNPGRSPAYRGPLVSLAEGEFVYIWSEVDGKEELYNERDDPGETRNLVDVGAMAPRVERFRAYLRSSGVGAGSRVVRSSLADSWGRFP